MPLLRHDTDTCAQLCAQLSLLTAVDAAAALAELERRFGPDFKTYMLSVVATSQRLSVAAARDLFTDAVVRNEWMEHVRAGRAFSQNFFRGAVVGNFSMGLLRAPAAGRVLVFSAHARPTAVFTASVAYGRRPDSGIAGEAGQNLLSGNAGSAAIVATTTIAALPDSIQTRFKPSGETVDWPADLVMELPVGQEMFVALDTLNAAIDGSFLWAEVAA